MRAGKIVLVLLASILIGGEAEALAQSYQTDSNKLVVFISGATGGAVIGGLATKFFKFTSAWASLCSGSSTPEQFLERYRKSLFQEPILLGPALGATAGVIIVGRFYQAEGNIILSLVGSLSGAGTGVIVGCSLLMAIRSHVPAWEFVATAALPIGWAAIGAVVGYGPHSLVRDQQSSSLPSMSLTLWSLRF